MSRAWHASISRSWMKESIPIFWQMTDMVVDYSLEPFWVPDLHPRSQERPPKSRMGSWFFKKMLSNFSMFLGVLWGLAIFLKKCSAKVRKCIKKFWESIFTFFNVSDYCDGSRILSLEGGEAPSGGRRPLVAKGHHKNMRPIVPWCKYKNVYIYIYIYTYIYK